jgi:hypothetical protein
MSTSKRTTKVMAASIALAGILALYASGLAMTVLTSSVPGAFAVSSSDSSSSDSSSSDSSSSDSSKIDKSEEQQILNGVKQCFDSSNDNRELEKCLSDTIDKSTSHSNQEQSSRSSNSSNSQ